MILLHFNLFICNKLLLLYICPRSPPCSLSAGPARGKQYFFGAIIRPLSIFQMPTPRCYKSLYIKPSQQAPTDCTEISTYRSIYKRKVFNCNHYVLFTCYKATYKTVLARPHMLLAYLILHDRLR